MFGKTILHYEILEKLGEGGMGVVYKAQDTKLDRTVALKFLPPELMRESEAKERFVHEARASAALSHSNICTIHEIDQSEGQSFIAMEYIKGETLKDKIAAGLLKLNEAMDIAAQVAQGLEKAHQKGIVHRDIKPANIFVTEDRVVKILDFGLAKLRGQKRLTKEGATVGTVAYMSPEQAKGEEVDHRTDIWSLGVVLYEMLTGQLPFKGEYDQAVVYSILNEELELPSSIRKDIPTPLERIVIKTLDKDPKNRYQNMEEVLDELKAPVVTEKSEERRKSIAVLPFTNMSADPEQEYFCDGMAEEIINVLSHIENLRVIARTSAFTFKGKHEDVRGIGRKLDVAHLLEGSVRKAGKRLRITAQLIKVDDGSHLWSERYDRELEDVLAIQDEIALEISNNLRLKLLKGEKASMMKHTTHNFNAYNVYMKGRYCLNKNTDEWVRIAITYFEKAIQEDVNYAAAHAALAESYIHLYGGIGVMAAKDSIPRARKAAQHALILDPSLAEAHVALGMIAMYHDWDKATAVKSFERAIELNPNYAKSYIWYASSLIYFEKDYNRAHQMIDKAEELDPLDLLAKIVRLNLFCWQNRFDDARNYCQKNDNP